MSRLKWGLQSSPQHVSYGELLQLLMGTPEQAAEQLMAYSERGVEHFVLSLAAPYDMKMVELYINEVAPMVGRLVQSR